MNRTRRTLGASATLVTLALTVGCSVATPDPSQIALHYSGGPFSSQDFENCVNPGVREVDSINDSHDYYPIGQRTFTFSDVQGADAPPLLVSTNSQIKLIVRGTITFRLNTSCAPYKDTDGRVWPGGLIQRFHDTIGRHNQAFATDGGQPQPSGWDDVIRIYVGGPTSKAMNDAGLRFSWQQLYADPAANTAWQQAAIAAIPRLIDQQAGGPHFLIDNVQFLQPSLPDALNHEIENNQAAGLRKATADTDKSAAEQFPGGIQGYLHYQQELAINQAIKDGKVRVIPIPQGSSVIVGAG